MVAGVPAIVLGDRSSPSEGGHRISIMGGGRSDTTVAR
jgi:hypothetical protein